MSASDSRIMHIVIERVMWIEEEGGERNSSIFDHRIGFAEMVLTDARAAPVSSTE